MKFSSAYSTVRFHTNFTATSHRLQRIFVPLSHKEGMTLQIKEVAIMFLGMEWYWWLLIVVALVICIPFKVKFMKWWSKREQEKKKNQIGKWGDEDDRG